MSHEQQPSVEEILEAIKKVIARDNRESAQQERRRRESAGVMFRPAAEPVPSEDVLDLGAGATPLSEEGRSPAEAGDALPAAAPQAERDADEEEEEEAAGLTAAPLAESMHQSFAALAMLAEPSARPQIVRSGETSLEGLVRDMLRPMLAQWLDQHLPDMVERLVKAEIARIAGKRG